MKIHFYIKTLLVLVVIAASGCEKNNTELLLSGNWELRSSINGLTGAATDYPPGNGSILKFSKNTYQIFSAGQLVKSGSYAIIKEINPLTKAEGHRLIYDNDVNAVKTFAEITEGRLKIFLAVYDGPAEIYSRINSN
jgi:hypothetical protein